MASNRDTTRNIADALLSWYRDFQRDLPWRRTRDPYRIWVSEVMLQQTQVATVVPYYERFLGRFPTVEALASAPLDDVLKVWEGLGYYARARHLHRAARVVVDRHGGRVPDDESAFRQLPGVGSYICAAVLSIAFDRPLAVVDGNVKRVLSRLSQIDAPVNRSSGDRIFAEHAKALLLDSCPGDYNQAMMELGALVCHPKNPDCASCPLRARCAAHIEGVVAAYPVREKKAPVPEYRVAVGVVAHDGRFLITQRAPNGLLGGLWEFPGGKIRNGESPRDACVREIREEAGLDVTVERPIARVKHAYTHFKVDMEVFLCRRTGGEIILSGPVDHRWISLEEIAEYAFPKANHKFIPQLRKSDADR